MREREMCCGVFAGENGEGGRGRSRQGDKLTTRPAGEASGIGGTSDAAEYAPLTAIGGRAAKRL